MFYDNSEPDFPNWWDVIDSAQETEVKTQATDHETATAISPVEDRNEGRADGETFDDRVKENDPVPYTASRGYERELVGRVWEFAEAIPGNDDNLWRKDEFGSWIYRLDYGRRESEFGWEIFDPGVGRHSQGVYAMRPLHWESFIERYETLG